MTLTLTHLQSTESDYQNLIARSVLPSQREKFQANAGIEPCIQVSSRVSFVQGFIGSTAAVVRRIKADLLAFFLPKNRFFKAHPIDPLTGLTSVAILLNGTIAASKAMQVAHRARLTGNREEQGMAYFNLGISIAQTGVGIGFLIERIDRFALFIKNNPVASQIAKVVGKATKIALTVISGLFLVNSLYRIYKVYQLNSAMNKSEHKALFIQTKLNPDLNALRALSAKERKQLLREALFYQREELKKQFDFAQLDPLKNDEAYDKLLIKIYGVERLQMDLLAVRGREELKSLGNQRMIDLIEQEKSSGKPLTPHELQEMASSVAKIASSKLEKLQKLFNVSKLKDIFLPAVRLAMTICLFMVTGQSALVAFSIAFLVLELLDLVGCKPLGLKNKLMEFIDSVKKTPASKHDKKMLWLHLFTLAVIAGLSIGLTVAFPALFPVEALITAAPILLAWLTANLYALMRYKKYEKARIEEAPTFANFSRYEELEKSAQKVEEVFQRIIKDDPDMRAIYARYHDDKREGRAEVVKMAKIVEEGKVAARRQEMRYALQHFISRADPE